jgi:hypothetical protein
VEEMERRVFLGFVLTPFIRRHQRIKVAVRITRPKYGGRRSLQSKNGIWGHPLTEQSIQELQCLVANR